MEKESQNEKIKEESVRIKRKKKSKQAINNNNTYVNKNILFFLISEPN